MSAEKLDRVISEINKAEKIGSNMPHKLRVLVNAPSPVPTFTNKMSDKILNKR